MAKINAINNQSESLTIDPGASGDSFVQFDINGTGEFRIGVDDDASDAFKISQGSALGTNDTFTITEDGERNMALTPCYSGELSAAAFNVTGDGTVCTVSTNTETFDQSGDRTSTTFTAPVTGRYYLHWAVASRNAQSSNNLSIVNIVTSNRTYQCGKLNQYPLLAGTEGDYSFMVSVLADMDAADTATCTLTVSGGGKVIDINATVYRTASMGFLVC